MSAEFAIALPAVVMMLAVVLGVALFGGAQIGLEDAARGAARELARGDSQEAAVEAAQRRAGNEVRVTVSEDAGFAEVTLEKPLKLLGLVTVEGAHRATATVRVEEY